MRISSTLYSSFPLIRSGGGCSKFGLWAFVSWYGVSREVWNIECIFDVGGSFSQNVMGPIFSSMVKGLYSFGASLFFGCVIMMFFPESQTFCPSFSLTSLSIVFFFISFAATSRLALVSFLILFRFSSYCSMFGMSNLASICGAKEGLNLYRS